MPEFSNADLTMENVQFTTRYGNKESDAETLKVSFVWQDIADLKECAKKFMVWQAQKTAAKKGRGNWPKGRVPLMNSKGHFETTAEEKRKELLSKMSQKDREALMAQLLEMMELQRQAEEAAAAIDLRNGQMPEDTEEEMMGK